MQYQNQTSGAAAELLQQHALEIATRTDRLFARLLAFEWVAGVLLALVVSPYTWTGAASRPHIHVWAAVFLGGAVIAFPMLLALARPGHMATRHAIAVAQMLVSALLIHLTGGRIETHFHVFGSLALLAFYRDWRVLATATIVVTVDHLTRGIFWPQSVYGVLSASPWRSLEHGAWVLFENVFLAYSCVQGQREMHRIASQRAELEQTNRSLQEQKHLAEQFAAQLQCSNRELQDFASVAGHDLQEPLRKIQAFSDRLNRGYGEALGDQGRDYLGRMLNAASRMQTLIQDLLTFSRVTAKARPFVPVQLGEVVSRVLSDLEISIAERNGTVEVGDLPSIEADPSQMGQLLQNLVGNALKFSRPGEAPLVKIQGRLLGGRSHRANGLADAGEEWCEITVEDNGIGFDEKYLDKIFTVFQRLHGRSEYEGTGIGLAICRKIVERHRGEITARSAPGQGAAFIVTLPMRQRNEEALCTTTESALLSCSPMTTPTTVC